MTTFTPSCKIRRGIESLRIERRYRNVLTLFLSGQMPAFTHERHADITDREWDRLDGALPDPARLDDLPGGADGMVARATTEIAR